MTFPSDEQPRGKKLGMIDCDYCGAQSECRFEYIDADKNNLPMLFCDLDCMTAYVRHVESLQGNTGKECSH